MLKIAIYTFNAIMPLILLIFLGYLLRKSSFINDEFIKCGNRLVFKVALPIQLFCNIYQSDSLGNIRWDAALYAMIGVFAAFLIGVLFASLFIPDPKQKGVVAQSFFRSNVAIIGVPLGQALGGASALTLISVVSSVTVAELNILGVIVLTMFLPSDDASGKHTDYLKNILQNPLIRSLIAGFLVLFIRSLLPAGADGKPLFTIRNNLPFVYKVLTYLSQLTTPLALIVLGGQFHFKAAARLKKQIFAGVFGCNFLMPGLALGTAILLNHAGIISFGSDVFAALVPIFASPAAFSSAVMAREMKNDGELAAQILIWSNVVSIASLFFWIFLLLSLGYLQMA